MGCEETVLMSRVVPLLKFTPSAQDPEVLETITVQREQLIANLVEVALDASGGSRHQLLVGPRGMGKTHILSLVASRVKAKSDPASVVVAWLEEDPWGVSSYEKFLAAIVARVAEKLSDQGLASKADELHALREGGGASGEQALRDAIGNSRLVLLVENLDDVFRRIGDNGQERFRAFVENWRRMVVIATAPQLFEGIQLHESPFYGFFAITHLEELSLNSASELMKRVAELRGDEELVRFLGSSIARRRLAAIEALAGGHPRIWLLLSGCVSVRAIDQLVPLFLQALDDLTPYYQDRLRELGDQQQEVVVLLCEAGGALSNRALSERSGIPQNQIATILRQLSTRGYVRHAQVSDRVATGDARMTFWEMREPLMRLCLDVKQARGRPLRMVVEFLRAWYGPRILDELVRLPEDASLAATYAGEAFRMLEVDLPIDELLRGSPDEIVSRADQGLRLSAERVDLKVAMATGLLLGSHYARARENLDELLGTDLLDGIEGPIRGLRKVAERGLGEDLSPETSVMELVEGTQFENAGIAAFLARSYRVLGLKPEALALFRKAAEIDRSDPRALREYGILASQLGSHEEALEVLTEAIGIAPKSSAAHSNRSIVLRRLGQLEEAVAEAREAVRLDPQNPRAQNALANALSERGEFGVALEAAAAASELAPTNASFLNNQGAILGRANRTEEAIELFRQAVAINPDDPNIQANLALGLTELGRFSEALPPIERSVELAAETIQFRIYLSQVLSKLDRHEDAVEMLEEAKALDPDEVAVLRSLGAELRRADRTEESLPVFRRAVELSPDDALLHGQFAVSLGELERFEEALNVLEEAIEIDPDNAFLRRNQCAAFNALGRPEDALGAIDRALLLKPDEPEYHEIRGIALSNLGRGEEAVSALQRAIELEPDSGPFHARLGSFLMRREEMEAALAEIVKAAELSPEEHEIRRLEADVLRQLGRLDEAEDAVAKARELAPNDYVVLFTFAEIALARQDVDSALGCLREALRIWSQSEGGPAGETDILCEVLWDRYSSGPRRRGLIEGIVRAYEEVGAVEALGAGLVESIPLFLHPSVSREKADEWIADWSGAEGGEELEIPLNLLNAAAGWKADRDRAHILALPLEQREILSPLLGGSADD